MNFPGAIAPGSLLAVYPYALPSIVGAALAAVAMVVVGLALPETAVGLQPGIKVKRAAALEAKQAKAKAKAKAQTPARKTGEGDADGKGGTAAELELQLQAVEGGGAQPAQGAQQEEKAAQAAKESRAAARAAAAARQAELADEHEQAQAGGKHLCCFGHVGVVIAVYSAVSLNSIMFGE